MRDTSPTASGRVQQAIAVVAISVACITGPLFAGNTPAGAATSAATSAPLVAVSCVKGSVCFGVGYTAPGGASKTVIKRWNGMRWTVQTSPNASTRYASALNDISCTSATNCFAVGASWRKGQTPPDYGTLVERWDGKKWAIVKTANVGGALTVSCANAASCFIGTTLRWNGKTWSSVNTKLGAYSLSCTSAANCDGVSNESAVHWNGKAWSAVPVPKPSSPIYGLGMSDVSCTSATSCFAIGTFVDGLYSGVPAAQRWNGKKWTPMPIPSPRGGPIYMYGVSCSGPKSCVAVGTSNPENGTRPFAVTEHWNGTKWSVVEAALPSGRQSGMIAVSCASTTDCMAVGASWTPLDGTSGSYLGPSRPLYEHWDGTAWSIV